MWTFLHEEEEGYSPFICTAACIDVRLSKGCWKLRPTKGSREWSKDAILGNNKNVIIFTKQTGTHYDAYPSHWGPVFSMNIMEEFLYQSKLWSAFPKTF